MVKMRHVYQLLSAVTVLLCFAGSIANAQGSTSEAFPSLMKPLAPSVASGVQISSTSIPAGLDQDHVVKVAGE
jgi:hypothetical protein